MLDSIYHMTLKLKIAFFCVKTSRFCHLLCNVIMDVIMFPENLLTTSGLSILLHGIISLSETRRHMINDIYDLPNFILQSWMWMKDFTCLTIYFVVYFRNQVQSSSLLQTYSNLRTHSSSQRYNTDTM